MSRGGGCGYELFPASVLGRIVAGAEAVPVDGMVGTTRSLVAVAVAADGCLLSSSTGVSISCLLLLLLLLPFSSLLLRFSGTVDMLSDKYNKVQLVSSFYEASQRTGQRDGGIDVFTFRLMSWSTTKNLFESHFILGPKSAMLPVGHGEGAQGMKRLSIRAFGWT